MDKVIVITGSSSGIGKASAKLFQEKGWKVVATMRQPDKEEELNTLDNVMVTRLDVQNLSSIEKAVAQSIEQFGHIDVLLNNAGYGAFGLLEAFSRERIRRQFDVNVFGLLDVTKAVLPHFRKRKSGMIINVSSIGGRMAFPTGSLYHGTKFALEGISEALSYELEAIGCKVKIVEPGATKSDFGSRSLDVGIDERLTEYQDFAGKVMNSFQQADRYVAEAREVAEVIYEAATDGSDQLRYESGKDAKQLLLQRQQVDDVTFMKGMKKQMGL